ncbi:hypothetical protein B0T26DRAFT_875158 [Lasiosphaeria miniovina]|uniref:NmrA-like domain-containing protein n=1 Tax=Lasiosphaeria miniovina TaxID=1954250 RepID=A0AA40A6S3_9PEZI|nr:uncharacterized protein B0T26DRAFT_875158 [Lasiosphaeria miniovina]KAK0710324.1 hypothetical protein B0T26DRAFT_875158 [Lasiosphaeria miniovina]
MATRTAFVCGVTGTQGGAVASQLRALGWGVHAATRDDKSIEAKSLVSIGVKLTDGSWEGESVELARRILRIAKYFGIKHAIFSGSLDLLAILGFDQTSFVVPFFQAKLDIEKELQRSGLDFWTILRPAFSMANFLPPKVNFQYGNATDTGVFPSGYNADTPIPVVDHQDMAAFAAAAFQNPETF